MNSADQIYNSSIN